MMATVTMTNSIAGGVENRYFAHNDVVAGLIPVVDSSST